MNDESYVLKKIKLYEFADISSSGVYYDSMKLNYIGAGVIACIIIAGAFYAIQPHDNTTDTKVANTNKNMAEQNIGGMVVVDEVVGTGATAVPGDTVTVDYVGALTNGKVFDASKNRGNQGFTFTLGAGQVIKGWDLGVAGMKVGGKRKLTIPADMAYGNQAVGGVIPANSTLVFEVELRSTGK